LPRLATWLPLLTRPLKHPGNHRYSFRLDGRRAPKAYGPERAYPKRDELVGRLAA